MLFTTPVSQVPILPGSPENHVTTESIQLLAALETASRIWIPHSAIFVTAEMIPSHTFPGNSEKNSPDAVTRFTIASARYVLTTFRALEAIVAMLVATEAQFILVTALIREPPADFMPSPMDVMMLFPACKKLKCWIVRTIASRIFGRFFISSGIAEIMPSANFRIRSTPAFRIFTRFLSSAFQKFTIISGAF